MTRSAPGADRAASEQVGSDPAAGSAGAAVGAGHGRGRDREDGVHQQGPGALRGYPSRYKNMMEQLQVSYITAIAAAAGCIMSTPIIDDGIDIELKHKSDKHVSIPDRVARLELQLKATADPLNADGSISFPMSRDRWEYYRTKVPTVAKIVVIMSLPKRQQYWTYAREKSLSVHYAGYWVNIADAPDTDAKHPMVRAKHLFNDIALCDIMERIGRGGAP